ncbi:MAG: triacylglycerol lipase [Gammaproteobacteria bacterium]|nr:MAG: triacylglycerol lipase [Gammaproteobacteria bacterium]
MRNLILALSLGLLAAATAHAGNSYTQTRYPIVLVHGIMGWDSLLGTIEHFYRIEYELERSGATVFPARIAFLNSNEYRADQLVRYINALGQYKVNIFAHSQGAPTARWAARMIPEKIASITSIHGANKGSHVADTFQEAFRDGTLQGALLNVLGNTVGHLVTLLDIKSANDLNCWLKGRCDQNTLAAINTNTHEDMRRQNALLDWQGIDPDGCGTGSEDLWLWGHPIKAFSWIGNDPTTTNFKWYHIFNPNRVLNEAEDAFLGFTSSFTNLPNDGLIDVCSQKFGRVLATYPLNHFDAVNHIFGKTGGISVPAIYRAHANRLKQMGL